MILRYYFNEYETFTIVLRSNYVCSLFVNFMEVSFIVNCLREWLPPF